MAGIQRYQQFFDRISNDTPFQICRLCVFTTDRLVSVTDLTDYEIVFKHITKLETPPGLNHPFRICQRCLNEVRQNVECDRMVHDADNFWTLYLERYVALRKAVPKTGSELLFLISDDESEEESAQPIEMVVPNEEDMELFVQNTSDSLVTETDESNLADIDSKIDVEMEQLRRADKEIQSYIFDVKEDFYESVASTEIFVHNNPAVVPTICGLPPTEMFVPKEDATEPYVQKTSDSLFMDADVADFDSKIDVEVPQLRRVDQKIETDTFNVEDYDEEPTEMFVHSNIAVELTAETTNCVLPPVIDSDVGNIDDFQPDNFDDLEDIPLSRRILVKEASDSRYCDICRQEIITKSFHHHIGCHKRSLNCAHCGMGFRAIPFSRIVLLNHLQRAHPNYDPKYDGSPFCTICKKLYRSYYLWRGHIKKFHSQMACSVCNKIFKYVYEFKKHKHPFACNQCDHRFVTFGERTSHKIREHNQSN